ncbi:CAP domain-containing protein [Streptomyces sp.]|uniref:CAP domain-containing protein n=1 Tax=Streptomyces sp. TaxID=1931 RepID=UPI002F3F8E84
MGRHSRHAQAPAPRKRPRGHRGRRKGRPIRSGLLTSCAALAVGAVVASTGLLSGVTDRLPYGGDGASGAQADGDPATGSDPPSPLGGSTTPAPGRTTAGAGSPSARGTTKAPRPAASPTRTAASPAATAPSAPRTTGAPTVPVVTRPATTAPGPPGGGPPSTHPATADPGTTARAAVLALANQERAAAGCSPLTASSALERLAQDFTEDMAARDFFDHTDPDGDTPWDRAAQLGITNLGGENIARGQADAQAVTAAWMNSPGHRANILDCDYRTLGVGVHYGTGGPWWTQDFGF